MQTSEFVTRYAIDRPRLERFGRRLDTLMIPARNFERTWGSALVDWMRTGAVLPAERLGALSVAYVSWFNATSDGLAVQLASATDALGDPQLLPALAEFGFHRVNARAQSAWGALLRRGDAIWDKADRARIRTGLEADLVFFGQARDALHALAEMEVSGDVGDDATANGASAHERHSESDAVHTWHAQVHGRLATYIQLLDIADVHQQVIVLPAPIPFSGVAESLVIDVSARAVVGVHSARGVIPAVTAPRRAADVASRALAEWVDQALQVSAQQVSAGSAPVQHVSAGSALGSESLRTSPLTERLPPEPPLADQALVEPLTTERPPTERPLTVRLAPSGPQPRPV